MSVQAQQDPKRARGRPRLFDRREAVRRAMLLFWDRGFEATSYEALLSTLGISASSFQKAFGTKERLFHEAADLYANEATPWFGEALNGSGDTRQVLRTLVEAAARNFTDKDVPAGCFVQSGTTQMSPGASSVRAFTTELRFGTERAVADRVRAGIAAGDMPPETDPDSIASFFGMIFRGMAVQARDGASRDTLETVGAMAMRAIR